VGFTHFESLLNSMFFRRAFINTIRISVATLIFGFPAPIILALLLNEVRNKLFKRFSQTISYLPHFISLVVFAGIILDFTRDTGVVSVTLAWLFRTDPVTMLSNPDYFLPVFVVSNIWRSVGWGSIIYMAALSSIDPTLYEAAVIDGANKWKQTLHVTLPGILPTIIILFILSVGNLLNVSMEMILLLANDLTWSVADVIQTMAFRRGLMGGEYGFATAVGLFNSVINFALLVTVNYICKKTTENSLW
jgi:putative aldouronate transport system permease protein